MSENSQTNPTLYELETQLEQILEELESDDPAIKEKAEESISQIILEIENKLDGYVAVINRLKNQRDFRRAEAKRINALAEQDNNKIKWLTHKLLDFLQRREEQLGAKGRKLEGMFCKVSLCNNGGKQPIWVEENLTVDRCPGIYVKQIITVDLDQLKEDAINYGEVLDERGQVIAKVMPRGKHLRIS